MKLLLLVLCSAVPQPIIYLRTKPSCTDINYENLSANKDYKWFN